MVSSPEFCFLQMASQLSLVRLIMLGYELCGKYSLPNQDDPEVSAPGFYTRQPLTSKKKLAAFLARMPHVAGRQMAIRALQYIQDGSWSPMETKLVIQLSLPSGLGGYGLALPNMNVRINLPRPARLELGKAFLVCDLFWPEHRIAAEYDSDLYHTGPQRIADDSRRRNYLTSIGIKTIIVTNQQIGDVTSLDAVIKVLASNMGIRIRNRNRKFATARQELRRQLA